MRTRPALTLVEVLASLVLIGSVITGLLVAQARSLEQRAATIRLESARELVEELLLTWERGHVSLEEPDSGSLPGDVNLTWVRQAVISGEPQLWQIALVITESQTGERLIEYAWMLPKS